jgi:hypothetical protein
MSGRTLFLSLLLLACAPALAQELEPRSYAGGPVDINFVALGYASSDGNMLFDASLPISDVQAKIDALSIVYGGTRSLFGRAGNFAIAAPYVQGDVRGNVQEQSNAVTRSGLGDVRLRVGIDLAGDAPQRIADYAKRMTRPLLGASLLVIAPTGQYDPSKLINISANRWAFKPEIGASLPRGRWLLEASLAAWLYTDNDDFYGGKRREQQVIESIQANVSYTFRPGLWIAGSSTYYWGGRTTVGGLENDDVQGNSRVGLALSVPAFASQSVKLVWSKGVSTRFGGDFNSWGVFWQYAWVRRP